MFCNKKCRVLTLSYKMENFDIIAAKMLQSETVSEVENHRARLIERDSAREPEKAGE